MKLKILGSAAAECWPALFCECDTCQGARRCGGKDLRRRTSYLLDDSIFIDFGPDAAWQVSHFDIDLRKTDAIFFTHSHEDHCNPVELLWRRPGFSKVTHTLHIYGNQAVLDKIGSAIHGSWKDLQLMPHLVLPGQTVRHGSYDVTAILANHCVAPEVALNYVFKDASGKTLLIGNDSGWWCEESWKALEGFKLDVAILDSTMGLLNKDCQFMHLGVQAAAHAKDRLYEQHTIDDHTIVVANHFSHNGGGSQQELEEFFAPHQMLAGYDGLCLTC